MQSYSGCDINARNDFTSTFKLKDPAVAYPPQFQSVDPPHQFWALPSSTVAMHTTGGVHRQRIEAAQQSSASKSLLQSGQNDHQHGGGGKLPPRQHHHYHHNHNHYYNSRSKHPNSLATKESHSTAASLGFNHSNQSYGSTRSRESLQGSCPRSQHPSFEPNDHDTRFASSPPRPRRRSSGYDRPNRRKASQVETRLSQNMSSDELCLFRTQVCPQKLSDDTCILEDSCPYSHCLSWHRRNPKSLRYRPTLCPNVIFWVGPMKNMRVSSRCPRGRLCIYSHTKEEQMYHPLVYKTQICRDWPDCRKYFCPFAHGTEEQRTLQECMEFWNKIHNMYPQNQQQQQQQASEVFSKHPSSVDSVTTTQATPLPASLIDSAKETSLYNEKAKSKPNGGRRLGKKSSAVHPCLSGSSTSSDSSCCSQVSLSPVDVAVSKSSFQPSSGHSRKEGDGVKERLLENSLSEVVPAEEAQIHQTDSESFQKYQGTETLESMPNPSHESKTGLNCQPSSNTLQQSLTRDFSKKSLNLIYDRFMSSSQQTSASATSRHQAQKLEENFPCNFPDYFSNNPCQQKQPPKTYLNQPHPEPKAQADDVNPPKQKYLESPGHFLGGYSDYQADALQDYRMLASPDIDQWMDPVSKKYVIKLPSEKKGSKITVTHSASNYSSESCGPVPQRVTTASCQLKALELGSLINDDEFCREEKDQNYVEYKLSDSSNIGLDQFKSLRRVTLSPCVYSESISDMEHLSSMVPGDSLNTTPVLLDADQCWVPGSTFLKRPSVFYDEEFSSGQSEQFSPKSQFDESMQQHMAAYYDAMNRADHPGDASRSDHFLNHPHSTDSTKTAPSRIPYSHYSNDDNAPQSTLGTNYEVDLLAMHEMKHSLLGGTPHQPPHRAVLSTPFSAQSSSLDCAPSPAIFSGPNGITSSKDMFTFTGEPFELMKSSFSEDEHPEQNGYEMTAVSHETIRKCLLDSFTNRLFDKTSWATRSLHDLKAPSLSRPCQVQELKRKTPLPRAFDDPETFRYIPSDQMIQPATIPVASSPL